MINAASEQSKIYFNAGFGWAESVLLSVSESYGIKSDLIPKIATGLCGGISRTSGMCGAVIGAIMALNIFFGRKNAEESKEFLYSLIQELTSKFENKFASTNCKELTECDLGTEEGLAKFEIENRQQKCDEFVEETTKTVMVMIESNSNK